MAADGLLLYRRMWIELAARANLAGDVRPSEVLALALATLPHTGTILGEHARSGIPDERTARWLAWVLDSFEDLCAAVDDLDDANLRLLVVDRIDPDDKPATDEAVLDMFQQNLRNELDALLSGPATESAA
ncbi:hypothetical protein [Nonomuraea sp. NPDC023979]|uniref:hypothetical protein n=1 Tax=Nonomuraea sp. NPDC023979 TaxID=3154796 RepID=UPI0033DB77A1